MKLFENFRRFHSGRFNGLFFIFFALPGCVTGNGEHQESPPLLSPPQQADGQATTISAEGQIRHEEECVPAAEANREQPPSVEVGLARDLAPGATAQPYTKFKCR